MLLKIEKWHGCQNDFIVTWISDVDSDVVLGSLKRQATRLCDRRTGVGADGVLVLTTRKRDDLTPYQLTIINSDGSIAKNCGNGIRCAASSILKAHRERGRPDDLPEAVELLVEGATMTARFLSQSVAYPMVAVEMGVPIMGEDVVWHADALTAVKAAVQTAGAPELAREVAVCELGNPHIVITSDHASRELMLKIGPALQSQPRHDGMNVHLVKPSSPKDFDQARAGQELGKGLVDLCTVYVWERGAGETMACGSGASAVAATAMASGLVDRDGWYGIDMPGGRLYARQAQEGDPIVLAGPATFVFTGTIEI